MKQLMIVLLITVFASVSLHSQKINYEESFEQARKLALQQKKPVAVLITIQPPVYTPNFMNGLNDKAVIEKFNSSFINYLVDRADTAASGRIIKRYKINRFPSYIFFDSRGGLMFSDVAYLAWSEPILALAQRALILTKEKSLVDYDSAFAAGENSLSFLKEYILKRENAGIIDNSELIEKYVYGLKVSDFNNYNEVLFILKAGPVVDGSAYKLARLNKKVIDSIYKTEPLAVRLAINNATITNTMNSAVAGKNFALAMATANFTRTTWSDNPMEGQKNWSLKLIQFYLGVKDTINYLQSASTFYEQYYMRLTVDSVRKKDSLNLARIWNNATQTPGTRTSDPTVRRSVSFIYAKDKYASELDEAASVFSRMALKRNEFLFKALLWSKRSIELSPRPDYYNTYAHLLYRLKFFDEAESMQKKAIESAKAGKTDSKLFQEEYERIRTRTL